MGSGMDLHERVSLTGVLLELSLKEGSKQSECNPGGVGGYRAATWKEPGENGLLLYQQLHHLRLPGTKFVNPLCAKASFRSSRVYDSSKETGAQVSPFCF